MHQRLVLIAESVSAVKNALAPWSAWRWVMALGIALAAAVLSGVPTGIVPSPLYHRMTPVLWWDYPFWAASSVLLGLLAASYARTPSTQGRPDTLAPGVGAGIVSTIAVGCPICNKIVVLLLGASGAVRYFAPVQPLLGFVGVMMLMTALVVRLRGQTICPLPRTGCE